MRPGALYYPISEYFQKQFGEKVYKVSVSVADTCPNRLGLKGMKTCTFCDVWGSAAYPEIRDQNLESQIESLIHKIQTRYKSKKFLVYFQSYTSTFLAVKKLERYYKTALEHPQVVGLVIGTRPDCISPALLDLWKQLSLETYLSIELGVQSFNNSTLKFLERGHSAEASIQAIHKIYEHTGTDIGLHFIFGNPNETLEDVREEAFITNQLPVHNVKLHNLHVLKNTALETLYNKGVFSPMDLETYTEHVREFLENLSPTIAIQRLSAVSSRWDELIAPEWTRHKLKTTMYIQDKLRLKNAFQGKRFDASQNHVKIMIDPTPHDTLASNGNT